MLKRKRPSIETDLGIDQFQYQDQDQDQEQKKEQEQEKLNSRNALLFSPIKHVKHVVTFLELKESKHILDKLDVLDEGSLVIFDLDNTLIEPHQLLGSDQWFEACLRMNKEDYGDKLGFELTLDMYNKIHQSVQVKTVEEKTHDLLNFAAKRHHILALTSRGKSLFEATHRQLASVNLCFNQSILFKDKSISLEHISEQTHAGNGIIFAGGKNKGHCLDQFLAGLNINPKFFGHIVFIDDKQHHLEHVHTIAKNYGVEFTGIRYGRLDHKLANVNLRMAELQYKHFEETGKFYSDAEAAEYLDEQIMNAELRSSRSSSFSMAS
jgi:Protein of unknown function (DUF2608)